MNEKQDSPTDPRIYMAAERTFLAWIRTGIAFMGFGFVVARFGLFLREIAIGNNVTVPQHNNGFSLPVGVALIAAGIIVTLIAAIRHHRYIKALGRADRAHIAVTALALHFHRTVRRHRAAHRAAQTFRG